MVRSRKQSNLAKTRGLRDASASMPFKMSRPNPIIAYKQITPEQAADVIHETGASQEDEFTLNKSSAGARSSTLENRQSNILLDSLILNGASYDGGKAQFGDGVEEAEYEGF